jgi:hypothetical protein
MAKLINKNALLFVGTGLGLGLLVGVGMMVGAVYVLNLQAPSALQLPETPIYATASDSSESLAIATGWIDEDVEGLYALDFLTGNLQAIVMYTKGPRATQIGGIFGANVAAELGIDKTKKPRYLMVTGQATFTQGASAEKPAGSVVYVVDANTGNFATYGLKWSKALHARGTPQQGSLLLLHKGQAAVRKPS